jgi:hypothetical protein
VGGQLTFSASAANVRGHPRVGWATGVRETFSDPFACRPGGSGASEVSPPEPCVKAADKRDRGQDETADIASETSCLVMPQSRGVVMPKAGVR